jgi:hypothetical protein
MLCAAALVLCLAVLPLVSMGQQATVDSQGRSITTVPAKASTPSSNVVKPDHANDELTTVIYSNFGHGDSYYCCAGWTESGADSRTVGEPWLQAMAFTPTRGDYLLLQIDLAIGYLEGTEGFTLELRADDGGQPGWTIASWDVRRMPTFGSSYGVETIDAFPSFVELYKGNQYWLVPIVNYSNEWAAWNENSLSAKGLGAYSHDGGITWTTKNYSPNSAFDVLGLKLD